MSLPHLPHTVFAVLAALFSGGLLAQAVPPTVTAALSRAQIPLEAVSLLVIDAEGPQPAYLSYRAEVPLNPASVMKLVTTYAALDLLGPAYSWRTPVYIDGPIRDGTLFGNLSIEGLGDPKLVAERLWLLLRRVQGLGIHAIAGDIVLDRSAFAAVESDAASFDGEPLRPYNAAPDALLVNFKAMVMTFMPNLAANNAQVQYEPPLTGVQRPSSVPLSSGACGNYRSTLQADFSDATRIHFAGSYPASCAGQSWAVAYADPTSFSARAISGLWREMGGTLGGVVREGRVPAQAPAFEVNSPPLAEVIRDINKYSNNVMAQQLLLTLSLAPPRPATTGASREVVRRWWQSRIGAGSETLELDNGAGLSRSARISAQALARLLQTAYRSPLMPELMASLPIVGVDGTLRRRSTLALGGAHLKTGSLRDVSAIAGYVHAASGKRLVLVAMVNHPNAGAARPAMEALVEWAAREH
jgi:D-alanyl-D-alanine carboxypeptidase/D-alanyl-D-alanine-endopeptidase (penicillin-binding protein 4)